MAWLGPASTGRECTPPREPPLGAQRQLDYHRTAKRDSALGRTGLGFSRGGGLSLAHLGVPEMPWGWGMKMERVRMGRGDAILSHHRAVDQAQETRPGP